MKSWLDDIDQATSEAQVVAAARDFCSLLHPRDLAPLPEDCRMIRIESGGDVPAVAARLARECTGLRSRDPEHEKLRELLAYLSRAAQRLGELRGARTL